jgi:hydroxyacylglutathione hydrolase
MLTMKFNIHPISALKDNYIWLIIDNTARSAFAVDPGDAKPVITYLETHQLKLAGILITHHHWDHTNGINELLDYCTAPVYGASREKVQPITNLVQDHDIINVMNTDLKLQVLAIPGHTLDHVAYYGGGIIFSGDTLFAAGCGRIFEGTPEQMFHSLQKIAALPVDTKLYCGHEYTLSNLQFAHHVEPSNKKISERIAAVTQLRNNGQPSLPSLLDEERTTNPFLRCDRAEIIGNVEKYAGIVLQTPLEVFTWLRRWKNNFS